MARAASNCSRATPVSVAVVGCGRHARNRLMPVLLSRQDVFSLSAICDADPKVADSPDFPRCGLPVEPDVDRVLSRDDVEGIIIATPPDMHAELTQRSLAAGKYVLVEKPPARSSAEWQLASQAAPQNVMVGFMKRFVPVYATLQGWLTANSTRPHMMTACFRSGAYPGVNVFLLDFGIHHLDLACAFLGKPQNVTALAAPTTSPQALSVGITFPAAVASLSLSWCSGWTHHAEYAEFVGPGWLARINNARELELYPPTSPEPQATATPSHLTWEPNYPISWREIKDQCLNGYEPELLAFAKFCRGTSSVVPRYEDGLTALRLCEAVQESVQKGGEIVAVE